MSETVHYRGKLKLIARLKENCEFIATGILKEKDVEEKDYYDSKLEHLCDYYYEEYFYYPKKEELYKILETTDHDLDEEIITAKKIDSTNVEFELRYYNGGAGFTECLEEALDKLN